MVAELYPVYAPSEFHSFIHVFQHIAFGCRSRVFTRYQDPVDGSFKSLTYEQFDRITTNLACHWRKTWGTGSKGPIGYLADHSHDYYISLFAALKARIVLLALSARNSEAAITSLMTRAESRLLITTKKYATTAKAAMAQVPGGGVCHILTEGYDIDAMIREPLNQDAEKILSLRASPEDETKIVLMLHSSGTTSYPKLVSHSNRSLIVLAQRSTCDRKSMKNKSRILTESDVALAGFPLFHIGGIFAALSPVMYHGTVVFHRMPMSSRELIHTIKECNVTIITVPPIILDQAAAYIQDTDPSALEVFKNLKALQFGGAALRKDLGVFFEAHGVPLQGAYGSTEIGVNFLSNIDEYTSWQSLMPCSLTKDYYIWEPYDEKAGTFHLAAKADSPALGLGVGNRPNGDFATNDLFVEETPNSGRWVYVGRLDDTLVMENGEKTNPTPMEAVISSHPIVKHCTVIGEGKQCTAALVELQVDIASHYSPYEMIAQVEAAVAEANIDAPAHSVILPQMIYIIPLDKQLLTTDKGTVMRKRSIMAYQDVVDKMYASFLQGSSNNGPSTTQQQSSIGDTWTLEQTEAFLAENVAEILKMNASVFMDNKHDSVFDYGLDSLLAIDLRNRIARKFDSIKTTNFVFEYPSIAAMAKMLTTTHAAGAVIISTAAVHQQESSIEEQRYQETQAILERYLARAKEDFSVAQFSPATPYRQKEVVLLTGATGSLGSFMLRDLILSSEVGKIYCPVRGGGRDNDLMDRLYKAFNDRQLDTSLLDTDKVEVIPADFNDPLLGWSESLYAHLKTEVTLVQANAWLLNFSQPIAHFDKECIAGLYNLLQFAYRPLNPMAVHTVSSISATAAMTSTTIPETILPQDPHVALPMGYAQSKYIVEHLFDYLSREKQFPCFVERMGQVCGDTDHGVWNTTEQYPLMMIGGGVRLKKMPDLKTSAVDWIPIDYAAKSIVEVMLNQSRGDHHTRSVVNIVNPNTVTWADVLNAMKQAGMDFEVVSVADWIDAVKKDQANPVYRLLSFYEASFANGMQLPIWETQYATKTSPTLRHSPPFSAGLMKKQLQYWSSVGFHSS